ncbi:hypothetical protein WJ89_08970 [Burkholderia ubonensis]|nr:hypothetical protein WJ89_08970 [Burkholderia ubonensis]KVQ73790.1 hypothetical protein WK06_21760 [Burkholderia ubonensis]KWD43896.1 hypothetical protein WL64_07160 [Burkholderia ubonensis]KWD46358.1 hypothetical protein WL63_29460 [Burkholderia ubonensis]KWO95096.1 hypothetical protein WM35_21335 [Burkholderia ubonensis]
MNVFRCNVDETVTRMREAPSLLDESLLVPAVIQHGHRVITTKAAFPNAGLRTPMAAHALHRFWRQRDFTQYARDDQMREEVGALRRQPVCLTKVMPLHTILRQPIVYGRFEPVAGFIAFR